MPHRLLIAGIVLTSVALPAQPSGQGQVVRVALGYRQPVDGQPKPNFSPKGMQVPLTAVASNAVLPPGAALPAKTGAMKIGPGQASWIPVLATATAAHPRDLCQLFIDRNRNGDFADDGPALAATPTQNEKTKAWWSSLNKAELSVPYSTTKATESYFVNFWIVREDDGPAPDILRFSVNSWRYGTATIKGIKVHVAAMDSDNDAVFGKGDMWSVVETSAPDAAKAVLSIAEARPSTRLMFAKGPGSEIVLEFRAFTPDGRSIEFAVVDKPVTKAGDRKADDTVGAERARPRAKVPFAWGHDFNAALVAAKKTGQRVFIDFETTWCGPCKSMDEWIWTDTDIAGVLNAGYVGVKLDGDIEKALVKRFKVVGYPTMIVLDPSGKEVWRASGYQSSAELLARFNVKR